MKLNLFSKMSEMFRHSFPKRTPEPEIVTEQPHVAEHPVEDVDDRHIEQVRRFLLKDDKLIGKPFNRHPEIRIVCVDNFVGAFLFFLRMCDQRLLIFNQRAGHLWCTANFPNGSGKLSFTDKITCRNKAVIAILKVECLAIRPQISEIRFQVKH